VPKTYSDFTTRRVLTTEWLNGEKLSQSKEDDVGKLVNVGVICYLKQLLQTGFFHADPHPGNLIRTPDGRLAILDFGLMSVVDDNIKYGMIEAISHLIHRDYEAIVEDFVTLDFIPEGTDLRPILPVLAKVSSSLYPLQRPIQSRSSIKHWREVALKTLISRNWRQTWLRSHSTTPSAFRPTSH